MIDRARVYAYDIDSRVPNGPERQADYQARSDRAALLPGARLDVAYGPHARHRLDVFAPHEAQGAVRGPAGALAPAILFFHGGYWKGGGKESRRFPAPVWNARDVAWVPVEYRLAPDASLDEIVDDARAATAWFFAHAAEFGCDPNAIHVAGNSAGGHITAMLLAQGWHERYEVPGDLVKSGTPVSGLFDFEPELLAYANEWLALDESAAHRNSPVHAPPRPGVPVTIAWGGEESFAFSEQSLRYGKACRAAGAMTHVFDCPGHDHYSIIGEFAQPESPLFQTMAGVVTGRASAPG